jgi:hypothetical protein
VIEKVSVGYRELGFLTSVISKETTEDVLDYNYLNNFRFNFILI